MTDKQFTKEIPPPPLTGMKSAQCPKCNRIFSTVGNFDFHLQRTVDGNRTTVSCINPACAGLVQDSRGVWRKPGDGRFLPQGIAENARSAPGPTLDPSQTIGGV